MKQLQDELGEFNDLSIQLQFLSHYLKDKKTTTHRYKAVSQLRSITQQRHDESKLQVIEQVELFSKPDNINTFQKTYNYDNEKQSKH